MIFATFSALGKIPVKNEIFNISHNGRVITGDAIFNNFIGTLLGPEDLLGSSDEIINIISSSVVGSIKNQRLTYFSEMM